jgi:hypothetical protein
MTIRTLQPSHEKDTQTNVDCEEYTESDGHDKSYFPIQPPDCPCTEGKDAFREDRVGDYTQHC